MYIYINDIYDLYTHIYIYTLQCNMFFCIDASTQTLEVSLIQSDSVLMAKIVFPYHLGSILTSSDVVESNLIS